MVRSIFFTRFFFTIYVPRFGKKKINDSANYLVCFVLYDPSLDQKQRVLRKEQENILKLNQTDWLVHLGKNPKTKHRFPLHYL